MYLRCYFIFTQLKATLRARWKGAGVGGERVDDGEVILLGKCLETAGLKDPGPVHGNFTSPSDYAGDLFGFVSFFEYVSRRSCLREPEGWLVQCLMGRLPTSTGDWPQVISSVFKFPFQSGALALQLLPLDSGLVESVPHGVRYSNTWSPAGDTVGRSYGEVHFFFFL